MMGFTVLVVLKASAGPPNNTYQATSLLATSDGSVKILPEINGNGIGNATASDIKRQARYLK